MPASDGRLTEEEDAEVDAMLIEAKAWVDAVSERANPKAVASAALLAGFHAYEDLFGTAALAELLKDLAGKAAAKAAAGPMGERRH